MGHRTGLDDVEKKKLLILPGLELELLGCPAHSLRMPISEVSCNTSEFT
jgi:hypothetical protein